MKTSNIARAENRIRLEKQRTAHHCALETLRAKGCELSGLQIWRKLASIEQIAHTGAEAACNGEIIRVDWPKLGVNEYNFRSGEDDVTEQFRQRVTDCVRAIFGHVPKGFFVNMDPRGYALKLDPDAVKIPDGMETDWGRNGLLAARIE